jgi:hypothetical protein
MDLESCRQKQCCLCGPGTEPKSDKKDGEFMTFVILARIDTPGNTPFRKMAAAGRCRVIVGLEKKSWVVTPERTRNME